MCCYIQGSSRENGECLQIKISACVAKYVRGIAKGGRLFRGSCGFDLYGDRSFDAVARNAVFICLRPASLF